MLLFKRLGIFIFYKLTRLIPDKQYLYLLYLLLMKNKLHLNNPHRFTEKLQWLKLYDRRSLYSELVDKCDVKRWVVSKIGEKHIIPTIGVYNSFDEIDFKKLPNQFVIKCTHNSGGVIICKDINSFNWEKARKSIEKQMKTKYFYRSREWPYKRLKPRIIIEKYMNVKDGLLKDYKIYCFNGIPHCLFITKDRPDHVKLNFYDLRFNKLPIKYVYPDYDDLDDAPNCWGEMIKIAKVLSEGIPFVRVDLYECNNIVYFGEMTFFPTGGLGKFVPEKWDYTFGEWLNLPVKNEKN